ncbi:MAG: AAA family ATPase [Thermomicrobiales bacterium]
MSQRASNDSGERSRFGELVRRYRRQRGLSQRGLADYILQTGIQRPEIAALGTLSERAISNLERRRVQPADHVQPRASTVELLAAIFELEPGTPEYRELFVAAGVSSPSQTIAPFTTPGEAFDVLPEQPPFVAAGRERHLEQCVNALTDMLAGRPRAFFVRGDAGSGKTRLLEEIARRALQAHPHSVVVWTECTSLVGSTATYEPVRGFLRGVTGDTGSMSRRQLVSHANVERLQRRAPSAIATLVRTGEELVDRFLDASTLFARANDLGLASAPETDILRLDVQRPRAARMFGDGHHEQFIQYLINYAGSGPVVWIIDDLQWADEGTCALIFHALRRLRPFVDVPVLIAGGFRPAELSTPGATSSPRHPLTTLVNEAYLLMPEPIVELATAIGSEPGRAFVDGLIDLEPNRIGPEFRRLLFERTEGHPLFVTELLHWFRETGTIVRDSDGSWIVANRPIPTEIPARITAVIAELLGRLTPEQRCLLEVASIRGDVFSTEVLARVLHDDPLELAQRIETQLIQQHGLLTIDGVATVAGRRLHRYRFIHALFREYLVDQMSERDRERAHLATGEALLEELGLGAHEGARELVRHFELANARRQTASACRDAGEYALNTGNIDEAQRLFVKARDLFRDGDDPAVYGQALVGLANCARALGNPEHAVQFAIEALAFANSAGVDITRAHSLATLGMMDYDAGNRLPRAAKRLSEAIALLADIGDIEEACRAGTLLSHAYHGLGKYDEALREANLSIATARRLGNDWLEAEAVVAAANCESDLGRYDDALDAYERGVALARAAGNHRAVALGLLNISLCLMELGQSDRATSMLGDVLALAARWEMVRTKASAEYYTGLNEERRANWAVARRHFSSSREQGLSLGMAAHATDCVAGLLRVAVAEHNRDLAVELLAELIAWHAENGITGLEHPARFYLSVIQAIAMTDGVTAAELWIDMAIGFLQDRASRIVNPAARRSFLHGVPCHRQLIELANARP